MRRSASRCDTIIDLIDHCLAEYDPIASSSRPDHGRSPRGQRCHEPQRLLGQHLIPAERPSSTKGTR
jgi:hypothetical protein